MKWVYLPVLFAFAFMYTKFSYNDFGKKISAVANFSSAPGRKPASVEDNMPRIKALRRVPASVLYKSLDDSSLNTIFQKVSAYRGTIIGNPHVESFGFVVDDKSKASFSVTEFPDASEGAYMHDVLAHLVSAKTIEKKINWISYFEAYKNGLRDQAHTFSFYVDKGLDNAVWVTEKNFEENVTNDVPFEFTQLKKTHLKVDAVKKGMIQDALKKKFGKIQFFDIYESTSEARDYELLVRVRPQDKIQWLSLDESSLCSYDQTFNQETKSISFERRFGLLKSDVFDGKLNLSLDSVAIDKKNYVMKFSDHFSAKLLLREIPSDDYQDIIFDQAYVLGKIHRRSLGEKADDYIKSWATISAAVIDEKVIELKYKLKDFQE